MKKHSKTLGQLALAATLGVMVLGGLACTAGRPDAPSMAANPANSGETMPAPVVKHVLSGAELYSMHCNRCHPERYPTERTAAQWKTIMLHMQIRANIPGFQARQILKYLQENSGR